MTPASQLDMVTLSRTVVLYDTALAELKQQGLIRHIGRYLSQAMAIPCNNDANRGDAAQRKLNTHQVVDVGSDGTT